MTIVTFSSAAFLCGMILFVLRAPMSTKCQASLDLTTTTASTTFLWPMANETTVIQDEEKCPATLQSFGKAQNRSTCPWSTRNITNCTLFPSSRLEAKCRCKNCIGSNKRRVCQPIYTEMMFLKQTTICNETGVYVYVPITLKIQTGCSCARKKIIPNF